MRQNPCRMPQTSDARASTKAKFMDKTDEEFPTYPDPPPGGFVEDPDFEFIDDEERELAESYLRGEWRPIEDQEAAKDYFQKVAQNTLDRLEREKNAAKPAQDAAD